MIQSVDRAMRILAVLQGRRMSLSEIASRLELAPSTAHGIVRTLVAHGMLVQERDSGHYRLGPATLRLGNIYLDTLELRSRVAGWAPELARRTGCAVRAGVLLLHDVVVVAHEPRPDGTRQMAEVGIVIPAHACAVGKAMLAHEPGAVPDTLHGMTAATITDPAVLAAELEQVRRTGIATEAEEAVIGECSLAAPLADATGLAGAVGLVTPSSAWPLPDSAVDALRDTARAVSRELGAAAWPPTVTADRGPASA